MEQQEVLTETKPDCDLYLLKHPINVPSSNVRALLHVNVWGALSDDRVNPLARIEDASLQITNLEKISEPQAMQRVVGWLGKDLQERPTEEERLTNNAIIQAWAGLTFRTDGDLVKPAPDKKLAQELNLPISPY